MTDDWDLPLVTSLQYTLFLPRSFLRLPPPSSFLSASLAIFHFFFSIANPDQLKSPLYHSRISTFTLSSRIPPLSNSASFLFIFLPPPFFCALLQAHFVEVLFP